MAHERSHYSATRPDTTQQRDNSTKTLQQQMLENFQLNAYKKHTQCQLAMQKTQRALNGLAAKINNENVELRNAYEELESAQNALSLSITELVDAEKEYRTTTNIITAQTTQSQSNTVNAVGFSTALVAIGIVALTVLVGSLPYTIPVIAVFIALAGIVLAATVGVIYFGNKLHQENKEHNNNTYQALIRSMPASTLSPQASSRQQRQEVSSAIPPSDTGNEHDPLLQQADNIRASNLILD